MRSDRSGSEVPFRPGPLGAALVALTLAGVAQAHPRLDPAIRMAERLCKQERLECVLGASERSRLRLAATLAPFEGDRAESRFSAVWLDLAPELAAVERGRSWRALDLRAEPIGLVAAGDLVPDYRAGDEEPGGLSGRVGAELRVYPAIFELVGRGVVGGDVIGQNLVSLGVTEAWAGVTWRELRAGFGLRPRHLGPGRSGSLMLTDNGLPSPHGALAWTSPAGQRFGRVHLDSGAGWIPGERRDVQRPGWLYMDARWLLLPEVELGLSRVSIFGGVGRPSPRLGQLLLPTDPHVYDDPNRAEPDQDERASIDLRLLLPVGRWSGLSSSGSAPDGIDSLELWWQYGGEDVIAREAAGLPYPSLAGVANLIGAEASAGPLVLSLEYARILDDTFRWYLGHRVYHDGFYREGRPLAHASGGDSVSWWGAAAWEGREQGAELSVEHRLRVGVIEALGPNLLALAEDERRVRVGLRGWSWTRLGYWTATAEVERIEGLDFRPEADGWGWRLAVGR